MRQKRHKIDVTIVGAGIAGLSAALAAADEGASVTVLAKASHTASNSYAAQGGVAAAVGEGDDPALHAADTLAAGRGHLPAERRRAPRERGTGPDRVATTRPRPLASTTVCRSKAGTRAGVSSTPVERTLGRHISDGLTRRAVEHPRIRIVEGERVTSLSPLRGSAVVLATGGYAALWSRTTNPAGATGEGLLLAEAAGAALADLELVLSSTRRRCATSSHDGYLLSEALRGAGATLLDGAGPERFVDELAR